MQTVTLGPSQLEVTPIAYGTWQFGGDWGPVDEQAALAPMPRCPAPGALAHDRSGARIMTSHPERGWSLLPDGRAVRPLPARARMVAPAA